MDKEEKADMALTKIEKRDGRIVDFDQEKITNAILKAIIAVGEEEKVKAKDLSDLVVEELKRVSGVDLRLSKNLVEATQDTGAFVQLSGVFKRLAVKLSKISNDLRLLSSGPRAGFHEINLPPVQPGSSIMPGKVNPVIPEVVNQVAFQVIGNDLTITFGAEAGQLKNTPRCGSTEHTGPARHRRSLAGSHRKRTAAGN